MKIKNICNVLLILILYGLFAFLHSNENDLFGIKSIQAAQLNISAEPDVFLPFYAASSSTYNSNKLKESRDSRDKILLSEVSGKERTDLKADSSAQLSVKAPEMILFFVLIFAYGVMKRHILSRKV